MELTTECTELVQWQCSHMGYYRHLVKGHFNLLNHKISTQHKELHAAFSHHETTNVHQSSFTFLEFFFSPSLI
jgi:hypothetical protein